MKINSLLLSALLLTNIAWFGCSNNNEIPILDCSQSSLAIVVTDQTVSDCNNPASITVNATGGTPPYLYSSNGIEFSSSPVLENLFAGSYTLNVRDANGCTADVTAVLEAATGSISFTLEFTKPDCGETNGTVTVSAVGGTPPYSYSLNGGSEQTNNIFTQVENGLNDVVVEDTNDCLAERKVRVVSNVSFSEDIFPFVLANCAITGCHDGSRSPDLRSSAGVMASADRIQVRTSNGTMPPSGRPSLNQEDIDKISCWLEDGAPG